MSYSSPLESNPVLADTLRFLRQRDLPTALRLALERMVAVARATAGTLYLTGSETVRLREGNLPASTLRVIEEGEKRMAERLSSGPLYAIRTVQTPLADGQTVLWLPLFDERVAVGFVSLLIAAGEQLGREQFDTLRTLCASIGTIGMVLGDLASTRDRLARVGLLYEMGQALGSTLDLQVLLRNIMELAAEVMHASASTLMLVDPDDSNYLIFEVAHGDKEEELRNFRLPITEGVAGWVATHNEPVISNDLNNDPRFSDNVDRRTGFRTRSMICVPVHLKDKVIGVLQVLNKLEDDGFDQEDLDLLLALAGQAAVAIENARLYRNLRQDHKRIIAVQEEVRKELARNLHDGTVQQMATMGLLAEHTKKLIERGNIEGALESLTELAEINHRAMRDARTLLFELRPVILEMHGLSAALQTYVERLNDEKGSRSSVFLSLPGEFPRLAPLVERTLFSIVQEAVGNARKHARAKTIRVTGHVENNTLLVSVIDDGIGFNPEDVHRNYGRSGSLGMLNMRERAELIDARYEIKSSPGSGTQVILRVPLPEESGE